MTDVASRFFGTCVRRLPAREKVIYLTFDDGPEGPGTEAVLDVLSRHQAHATFFMIGRQAQRHPELARQVVKRGHAVGNHSLDHRYRHFFTGGPALRRWIQDGESCIHDIVGQSCVGFRPPAGVRTPPLGAALHAMNIPLVLWSMRYYDAIWTWTQERAQRSLARLRSGDIVLLHDRQRAANLPAFSRTLPWFLTVLQDQGYRFAKLEQDALEGALK
jgi:peptidoglycan/xylan/chitin deacetylase (PgdA/CDA1 family)